MRVNLTYFKQNGAYYMTDTLDMEQDALYRMWQQVAMAKAVAYFRGKDDLIILVDVPAHPHNHPHLILPINTEREAMG